MPKPPHLIEVLAFPNVQILDVTGPSQVFATANRLSGQGAPLYDIRIVAADDQITSCSGLTLQTQPIAKAGDPVGDPAGGTVIVAGGYGIDAACRDPALIHWLIRRATLAGRIASVCSGAFLLAEAGLLDGRPAVTHWNRCAEFAARFPQVKLNPDPIFIRDGHIWTSAGVTAGIDLALAMVEQDHGQRLALAVARQLVVFLKRPGGQSQFSAALSLQTRDPRFQALHAWIAANLTRRLTLEVLADQAGMSVRSFARHYHQGTGQTPAQAVEGIRVEHARGLLEAGGTVATAARRSGFGATETMRRAFLRRISIGPQDYQQRFGR